MPISSLSQISGLVRQGESSSVKASQRPAFQSIVWLPVTRWQSFRWGHINHRLSQLIHDFPSLTFVTIEGFFLGGIRPKSRAVCRMAKRTVSLISRSKCSANMSKSFSSCPFARNPNVLLTAISASILFCRGMYHVVRQQTSYLFRAYLLF